MIPVYSKEEAARIVNQNKRLDEENQVLRSMEKAFPKTLHEKFQMIEEMKSFFSIELLCRVLEVNRSSYYKWNKKHII
ncbi:hypothetical protein HB825_13620 [Listeria booriae]|uniref:hypothetical protein n=1 Tax=Listeria booriae TaxID=1552123 RepID=UPI0016295106|nr:hypothetical protein [Listeria booriae]MBC1334731.1 hypothetical protein [Listeria booriae]MBC1943604.1 hypothetical protein [Listeria booriae]MBC6129996.1 hypothetical protein [Listeria booriae]MBC6135877.1 hypothetical protein [Listeria booriae]MBC6166954.1 hypothetical protein [Listeria booriae]